VDVFRDLQVPVHQHRFFIVGLIPDIAALREGPSAGGGGSYGMLSPRWDGLRNSQWRHYRRAYGLLAAFATPSCSRAQCGVGGTSRWRARPRLGTSILFAPFFVDGAIFSGFRGWSYPRCAMRHFFRTLRAYVTDRHLDMMAS